MCPTLYICNAFKESPKALISLQSRGYWHYDIMSEFTIVDKLYTNVNNVCKNKRQKIFLSANESVQALNIYGYSVIGWSYVGKCVIKYYHTPFIVQLLNTQPLVQMGVLPAQVVIERLTPMGWYNFTAWAFNPLKTLPIPYLSPPPAV